ALPLERFSPKTGDPLVSDSIVQSANHVSRSRAPPPFRQACHGDARGQEPLRQAPVPLPLRRARPSPLLPSPLRHLLPAAAAAARRSSFQPPLSGRVRGSGRCCLPVHCAAAGPRGGPAHPGASASVLRHRRRLDFVFTRVFLGCNSLVCWRFYSILCCFGPQGEAWIDCMHYCWYFRTSSFHPQWHKNESFLVILEVINANLYVPTISETTLLV
ncbi:hypothetical protein E2562_028627, partial [Oryza meyeriana var. granulata]